MQFQAGKTRSVLLLLDAFCRLIKHGSRLSDAHFGLEVITKSMETFLPGTDRVAAGLLYGVMLVYGS